MPSPGPQEATDEYRCLWDDCTHNATDGDQLYLHLCNAHIGRKSTNNLCLTCHWNNCGTSCSKRDHITSHLRVHIPLKPHSCEVCNKSFKRPQDLKKHEKIHTEEHHAQHKHSKAITVADPAYSSRVRGPAPTSITNKPYLASAKPGGFTTHSRSPSTADEARTPADGRTSSPHVVSDAYGHYSSLSSTNSANSWDYGLLGGTTKPANKRGHDDLYGAGAGAAVDGFFRDMKKRKYASTYDSQMAERLSALSSVAFAGHKMAQSNAGITSGLFSRPEAELSSAPNINPTLSLTASHPQAAANAAALALSRLPSSALPGTPEELAIVNQFLVRLGEEIAAGNVQPNASLASQAGLQAGFNFGPTASLSSSASRHPSVPSHVISENNSHSYFDANTLAALGIANVPGLNSYNKDVANNLYSQAAALAGLAPSHPANAAAHAFSNTALAMFGGQRPGALFGDRKPEPSASQGYPLTLVPSPGRSSTSGSSDNDTLAALSHSNISVSPHLHPSAAQRQYSQGSQSGWPAELGGNGSASDGGVPPRSPGELSHTSRTSSGASPYPSNGSDFLNGVPTTKETPRGMSIVNQLAPMDPSSLPTHDSLPLLQSAPVIVKEEEVDELNGDPLDEEMHTEDDRTPSPLPSSSITTFTTSNSRGSPSPPPHFPSRNLPLPRPTGSGGRAYGHTSGSSSGSTSSTFSAASMPRSVTLPSVASLIHQADEIAEQFQKATSSGASPRNSSEETEDGKDRRTPPTRTNLYPSLGADSPAAPGSPRPTTSNGHDVVLPGIASLALDLPNNKSGERRPSLPGSSPRVTEERMSHVELIKAMLVWVNAEYVARHGDPWQAAAKAKQSSPSSVGSERVGMLRKVVESDSDEQSDDDSAFESEDELGVQALITPSDVEMDGV